MNTCQIIITILMAISLNAAVVVGQPGVYHKNRMERFLRSPFVGILTGIFCYCGVTLTESKQYAGDHCVNAFREQKFLTDVMEALLCLQ